MHNLVSQRTCPRCQWSHHESETSCHWCNYNMIAGTTAADRRHAKHPNFYLVRPTPTSLPIVTGTLLRAVDRTMGLPPSLAGDPATSRAMSLRDAWHGINALVAAGVFCRWEIRDLMSSCRILGDPSLPLYAVIEAQYMDMHDNKQMCMIAWTRYLAKVHPVRYQRLMHEEAHWMIITTTWLDIKIEAAHLLTKVTK